MKRNTQIKNGDNNGSKKQQDQEIKELKEEIKKLKNLVIRDGLTGALNKKGIQEEFDILFKEAFYIRKFKEIQKKTRRKLQDHDLSIVFIDLDDFKKINDKYGHNIGDQVLKMFFRILKEKIRAMDLIGRFGGEEFVIALPGASESVAYKKTEELRRYLQKSLVVAGHEGLNVTFSAGVASFKKTDAESIMDLIAMADKAMYEAKMKRGKNNTVKYSEIA